MTAFENDFTNPDVMRRAQEMVRNEERERFLELMHQFIYKIEDVQVKDKME
jgi:hypothetical protein